MAKPDQTQLNLSPSSQSNAGSAGGTMYYINLGGIKILWAQGANVSVSSSGTNLAFTLPSGFFSTVQTCIASPTTPSATGSIYCEVDSYSTSAANIKVTPSTSQTNGVSLIMIGT